MAHGKEISADICEVVVQLKQYFDSEKNQDLSYPRKILFLALQRLWVLGLPLSNESLRGTNAPAQCSPNLENVRDDLPMQSAKVPR